MKTKTKKRFTARLTKKGQVTIPIFLRETLQVNPHEEIEFVLDEDNIVSLWKSEQEKEEDKNLLIYGEILSEEWNSEADNLAYNDL